MKYYIIADEKSSDLHAARLVEEIKRNDIRAEFCGVGGRLMQEVGVKIVHFQELFTLTLIGKLISFQKKRKRLRELKKNIKEYNPDILILVSSLSSSLKIASYAKKHGIKTCYYIPPKIWSWKKSRISRAKSCIDKILVTLPFEVAYYKQIDVVAEFVGNPIVDSMKGYSYDPNFQIDPNQTTIAVLPGSRIQEIESLAKIIQEIAKQVPSYKFLIAGEDHIGAQLYSPYKSIDNVEIFFDKSHDILKRSNAAIVSSGIGTLETALLNCPQVVVYRTNPIQTFVERLRVKDKWLSIVNLIAQKEVVKELTQQNYNADSVLEEVKLILTDHQYCAGMMQNYQELLDKIGTETASRKAARVIVEWLED